MPGRVLIAGCGDLGIRIGQQLLSQGWEVIGLRRHPGMLPAGIEPLAADLGRSESLTNLPRDIDSVVFCPTARSSDESAYRATYVAGLRNLIAAWSPSAGDRLVFVSSTSVYAQSDGSWVDESSDCQPTRFNGQVMLEAEHLALNSPATATTLRLSGIYGPGREQLLDRVRNGKAKCQSDPIYWTNRIHQDDCARMVRHLLSLERPDRIYVGSDDCPAAQHEVIRWLADRLAVPAPQPVSGDHSNKRLSNRKIRESGFACRYENYRRGYGELIKARR
jgi:nucleoside-diphosphate-sugar epimerase